LLLILDRAGVSNPTLDTQDLFARKQLPGRLLGVVNGRIPAESGQTNTCGHRIATTHELLNRNLAFEALEPPRRKTFPKNRVRVWVQPAPRFLLVLPQIKMLPNG